MAKMMTYTKPSKIVSVFQITTNTQANTTDVTYNEYSWNTVSKLFNLIEDCTKLNTAFPRDHTLFFYNSPCPAYHYNCLFLKEWVTLEDFTTLITAVITFGLLSSVHVKYNIFFLLLG